MSRLNKIKEVAFATDNLNEIFLELKEGKFEDKQLLKMLNNF